MRQAVTESDVTSGVRVLSLDDGAGHLARGGKPIGQASQQLNERRLAAIVQHARRERPVGIAIPAIQCGAGEAHSGGRRAKLAAPMAEVGRRARVETHHRVAEEQQTKPLLL